MKEPMTFDAYLNQKLEDPAFKAEWDLEILDNAGDYAAVEIENVAAPVS